MGDQLDTDIAIETPEHIVFRYRVAGPMRRFFAYAIDTVLCYGIIVAVVVVAALAIASLGLSSLGDAAEAARALSGLILVLLFLAQWVYFTWWEFARGRTPGKRMLALRVLRADGTPLDAQAAALRNVLRAVDALPLPMLLGLFSPVGLLSMAVSKRFQRIGDLVAGTMVVVSARSVGSAPVVLWPVASAEEVRDLPARVLLDQDERHAIELFLRRVGTLGRERELELARILATPLATRLGAKHRDPVRLLALLYDRAIRPAQTSNAPPSPAAAPPHAP